VENSDPNETGFVSHVRISLGYTLTVIRWSGLAEAAMIAAGRKRPVRFRSRNAGSGRSLEPMPLDENLSADWAQGLLPGEPADAPACVGTFGFCVYIPKRCAGLHDHYTLSVRCHMSETFWISVAGNELMIPSALSQDLDGFVLSAGTRALLAHAARINYLKKENRQTLSSTYILAAAIDLARKSAGASEAPDDDDQNDLRAMHALDSALGEVTKDNPRGFELIVSDGIDAEWEIGQGLPDVGLSPSSDIGLSESDVTALKTVAAASRGAGHEDRIFVAQLIPSLVSSSPTLQRRLREIGSSAEDLLAAFSLSLSDVASVTSTPPPTPDRLLPGRYPIVTREATWKEDSLNVRQYAVALTTLLRTASGELCLGIFGHWGIGKTHLANMIRSLLTEKSAQEALADELKRVGVGPDQTPEGSFGQGYQVVFFSAWKYRRTPELWVYLYETLSDACMAGWTTRWSRLLRYNVLKQGHWPLVLALISTGAALASVSFVKAALGAAVLVLPLLGLGGLWWLIHVTLVTEKGMATILKRYTTLARHNDKLGLQALIGDELRCLILAWAPHKRLGLWQLWPELLTLPIVVAMWFLARLPPEVLRNASLAACNLLPSRLIDILPLCSPTVSSALDWQAVLAFALWLLLLAVVVFLLWWRGRPPTDRILLIVDDLDRCGADEIVEAMESLKLLLEDKEIQDRVQVLMLVDEGVMEYAIAKKFEGLIQARARARAGDDADDTARREVVREHMEKLFLCHLRLPALSRNDVKVLAERFAADVSPPSPQVSTEPDEKKSSGGSETMDAGETPGRAIATAPSPSESSRPGEPYRADPPRAIDAPGTPGNATNPIESPTQPDAQLFFTQWEMQQLAETLAGWSEKQGRIISPRAIRAFLLKYQLARLLRQLAKEKVEGAKLMEELAKACFGPNGPPKRPEDKPRHEVEVIVAQLA
jgi:hypothetical protein